MPVRVHMVREPDPEHRELLVDALKGTAEITFGTEIHPQTRILVEGQLTEEHMGAAPLAEHVVIPFAGLQPKTREVLRNHPAVIAHNLHHNAAMTAEMAMALMLACARRIVQLHTTFSHDDWEPRYFSRDAATLFGKTVVVLGFGAIGQRVGKACEGFGMEVVGVRSQPNGDVHGVGELHELLPKADYLVVTLPGTDATDGLIGEREIALLQPHAIVVNVGRGRVIDERALYEALAENRIDAAGLDVWWVYPKAPGEKTAPSEYPFATLPNVVMTPHVGGATRDAEPERVRELARLVKAIIAGDDNTNLIDLSRGY
jgi:phosphoglycerate dehydrogenase-like enzyme